MLDGNHDRLSAFASSELCLIRFQTDLLRHLIGCSDLAEDREVDILAHSMMPTRVEVHAESAADVERALFALTTDLPL